MAVEIDAALYERRQANRDAQRQRRDHRHAAQEEGEDGGVGGANTVAQHPIVEESTQREKKAL
jgi:hypothetical protein